MRTYHSEYELTTGKTLAAVDLEAGDFLPEHADYLIESSRVVTNRARMGAVAVCDAVKPVTYTGTNPFAGGMVELTRTRGIVREGENVWNGVRWFICPNSLAHAAAKGLWDQLWPDLADARCRKTAVEREWLPGYSRIAAYYQTTRVPGKARLLTRMETMAAGSPNRDLDDKLVYGPEFDAGNEWRIVRGKEFADAAIPFEVVVLQTAYYASDFQLGTGHGLYRTVNDADLPNFGNAKKGSLLFIGQRVQWEWGDDLLFVDYYFQWSGNEHTWNEVVQSQLGHWGVEFRKGYRPPTREGGAFEVIDGWMEPVWVWRQGVKKKWGGGREFVDPEPRRLFEEKSFGALAALVSW